MAGEWRTEMTSISFAEVRGAAQGGSSGTRTARGRAWHDYEGPRARARRRVTPGGRPHQPGGPLVGGSCVTWSAARSRLVAGHHGPAAEWRLTDVGLVLLMVSFALAIVLGAVVVVKQYLAIGAVA